VVKQVRVLFVCSEYAPLVKTGGLGDVCGALPHALRALGLDVRVLLPAYPAVLDALPRKRLVAPLEAEHGFPGSRLLQCEAPGDQLLYAVDCPALYAREGLYQDGAQRDWPDNALRFGLLARAAALLAQGIAPRAWRPDLLHCHDWHAALAPAYLRFAPAPRVPCILTVHNLAFQGLFSREFLAPLGLPPQSFAIEGLEYYGRISFLKAGLVYSDWITTVSPTYAREIQGAALGCGLDGVLRARSDRLTGILNGIDTEAWDPRRDRWLARRYGPDSLEAKTENKAALQRELGLAQAEIPLFGVVSRFTGQKGVDLVADLAPRIAAMPAQLVVLGSGNEALARRLGEAAGAHPESAALRATYDEPLAHRIEAGADAFLMPSRFEPCGMNQMYSQRYGTPPVVRATGGLADSVVDCTGESLEDGSATGFVFREPDTASLFAAVERAARLWRDRDAWRRLQRNGMARDFSWKASARRYAGLYERLAPTATRSARAPADASAARGSGRRTRGTGGARSARD
jgi:starch synthase